MIGRPQTRRTPNDLRIYLFFYTATFGSFFFLLFFLAFSSQDPAAGRTLKFQTRERKMIHLTIHLMMHLMIHLWRTIQPKNDDALPLKQHRYHEERTWRENGKGNSFNLLITPPDSTFRLLVVAWVLVWAWKSLLRAANKANVNHDFLGAGSNWSLLIVEFEGLNWSDNIEIRESKV